MPWRGDAFPSLPLRDVSPLHKAQAFCVRGAVAPSEEGAGSAPEAASAGLRSCVSSCARIFRRPLASYELCGSAPLAPGYPPNPCRCRARRGGGAPPRPFLPESGYPPPSLPAPILFFLRFPPLPPLRPPLRRRAEGERGRASPGPGGGGARRGRSFFFPAGRHERCARPPCREGGVRLG